MKKQTVGIVTIQDSANIGNRLQNYAVQRLFEEKNVNAVTVRFLPPFEKENAIRSVMFLLLNRLHLYEPYRKRFNTAYYEKYYSKKYVKHGRYDRSAAFNKKYIKMLKGYYCGHMPKRYLKKIDKWIAGSDQIWNPYFCSGLYRDFYFLSFAEKAYSFSASFGVSFLSKDQEADYSKRLARFRLVSVREQTGVGLAEELTAKPAELILDPTLLIDAKQWAGMARPLEGFGGKRFIVTLFWKINEAQQTAIDSFAAEKGFEVIDANGRWFNKIGMEEFIWLIANAEYVFTESFHFAAFSANFGTKFVSFKGEPTSFSRIEDTLRALGAENLIYRGDHKQLTAGDLGSFVDSVDFSVLENIPGILKREREKADLFIEKILAD